MLEYTIEGSLRVESAFQSNAQYRVIVVFGIEYLLFYLVHPVSVYEVEEI